MARALTNTQVKELAHITMANGHRTAELLTGVKAGGSEWVSMATPLWAAALHVVRDFDPPYNCIAAALSLVTSLSQNELHHIMTTMANAAARREYNLFLQSAGSQRTASSILTVLASCLQLFTDEAIVRTTALDELDGTRLRDEPTVLYVIYPERKSAYLAPLMAVFYTQLLDAVLSKDGLPVYLLLDEFANIGIIPQFAQVAATARSRKVSLSIGIQGIEQLEHHYGKETAHDILNNLKVKVFYPGLAHYSAQYASQLSGVTGIETQTVSYEQAQGRRSYSYSETRRELLHPDEIRRMPEDKVLIIAHNRNPVMDEKLVYYRSKALAERVRPSRPEPREDLLRLPGWFEAWELRRLIFGQGEPQIIPSPRRAVDRDD